jgi:hypothetical protein
MHSVRGGGHSGNDAHNETPFIKTSRLIDSPGNRVDNFTSGTSKSGVSSGKNMMCGSDSDLFLKRGRYKFETLDRNTIVGPLYKSLAKSLLE